MSARKRASSSTTRMGPAVATGEPHGSLSECRSLQPASTSKHVEPGGGDVRLARERSPEVDPRLAGPGLGYTGCKPQGYNPQQGRGHVRETPHRVDRVAGCCG